jgi:hypothetical protein
MPSSLYYSVIFATFAVAVVVVVICVFVQCGTARSQVSRLVVHIPRRRVTSDERE